MRLRCQGLAGRECGAKIRLSLQAAVSPGHSLFPENAWV